MWVQKGLGRAGFRFFLRHWQLYKGGKSRKLNYLLGFRRKLLAACARVNLQGFRQLPILILPRVSSALPATM
jgi:hypothetical protein